MKTPNYRFDRQYCSIKPKGTYCNIMIFKDILQFAPMLPQVKPKQISFNPGGLLTFPTIPTNNNSYGPILTDQPMLQLVDKDHERNFPLNTFNRLHLQVRHFRKTFCEYTGHIGGQRKSTAIIPGERRLRKNWLFSRKIGIMAIWLYFHSGVNNAPHYCIRLTWE